jgi:hypothetical protein
VQTGPQKVTDTDKVSNTEISEDILPPIIAPGAWPVSGAGVAVVAVYKVGMHACMVEVSKFTKSK